MKQQLNWHKQKVLFEHIQDKHNAFILLNIFTAIGTATAEIAMLTNQRWKNAEKVPRE